METKSCSVDDLLKPERGVDKLNDPLRVLLHHRASLSLRAEPLDHAGWNCGGSRGRHPGIVPGPSQIWPCQSAVVQMSPILPARLSVYAAEWQAVTELPDIRRCDHRTSPWTSTLDLLNALNTRRAGSREPFDIGRVLRSRSILMDKSYGRLAVAPAESEFASRSAHHLRNS
jgi:hypothetical protein